MQPLPVFTTQSLMRLRCCCCCCASHSQVYNPPNATPIIVDKISEQDFISQVTKLRDKRQTLQVKHAYRLRNDSKRALKVRTGRAGWRLQVTADS